LDNPDNIVWIDPWVTFREEKRSRRVIPPAELYLPQIVLYNGFRGPSRELVLIISEKILE
jgi:hypothetical protein